jgi:transcriptional regulator with XRE-family HTH domain
MPENAEMELGSVLGSVQDVVEEPAVEMLIGEKDLGARLKALRLRRSLGLVELGQRSGLSPSYLSQLETGRVVPTLRNLARIAMVHRVDLSSFFAVPQRDVFRISKARDRIKIPFGAKHRPFMLSQSMSALIPDRRIVPCIAELLPGSDCEAFDAHPFDGLEFSYIMQGSVCVTTPQRTEVLEERDVVWIEGTSNRRYKCVSDVPAKVLIISLPRHLARGHLPNPARRPALQSRSTA